MNGMPRLFLVFLGWTVAGCNPGPETYALSGQATYQGKPIHAGTIYFEPDTEKGGTGPQGLALIENGHYRTVAGKGVGWGAYKFKVVGYDGQPATVSGEELPDGKPLFVPYEATVELPRATSTYDIVVPDSGTKTGAAS
jgi:hypothetical protein